MQNSAAAAYSSSNSTYSSARANTTTVSGSNGGGGGADVGSSASRVDELIRASTFEDAGSLESRFDELIYASYEDTRSMELIHASVCGDAKKVLNLLLLGVPVDRLDKNGHGALIHACTRAHEDGNHFDVVRVLTGFDGDLNVSDKCGNTLLQAVCQTSKNVTLMEYLVKHGARVAQRNFAGSSILHYAAAGVNVNGIAFALRQGIPVDDRDNDGDTPLLIAAMHTNDEAALECLVRNGADVGVTNNAGDDLLHVAIRHDNPAGVEFALEKGLKVNERRGSRVINNSNNNNNNNNNNDNNAGQTALDVARATRVSSEIVALLTKAVTKELTNCSCCDSRLAGAQFQPCYHAYACAECCVNWKKCGKCGAEIEKKIDLIVNEKLRDGERATTTSEATPDSIVELVELADAAVDAAANTAVELAKLRLEKTSLERERENLKEEKLCVVCWDKSKAVVFNCGHTVCETCGRKLSHCHVCRDTILTRTKFYS